MPARLAPFDLLLVALYLVGITLFGLRFSRKTRGGGGSLKSYFLAGNTIPWWAIALSIVSAETSTLTIISVPGVAFTGNFGFLQIVAGYMIGRVVVALLFLPRYLRGEMLTAYQLIDRRFGPTLHKLTAGLFLVTRAAAEGVRVFAISIVVSIAIGTGDILSIGLISALTLLYTFEGGMAAVVWTDVVQMGLYLTGTLVALWTLGAHVPGGWAHIHAVGAPLGKFHVLDWSVSLTKTYTFWAGVLGGTFLTMASHGTDQLMVQRMLAARNLRESRLALLSSGAVVFVQFTLFLLIGAGLYVFYGAHPQSFSSPDRIFPTFIVREMPRGVAGLLVAAILAAAMSNLSAALNSLASTTVVDFYLPWRPQAVGPTGERTRTLVSRGATVFWAVVLFAIAVYSIRAGGKGHVVETGLAIASVAYGCLLGVFLLGTLTRFATEWGTIVGMACGLATNLLLWLAPPGGPIPHVAWTWYVLIGSGVTFAVGALASLARRKRTTAALIIVLVLTFLSTTGHAQQPSGSLVWRGAPSPELFRSEQSSGFDFSPVSAIIDQAISQKKMPGAVVVVGHGGRMLFEQAHGRRALEPIVEPMTTDTLFDIASLTKVFTATAVMQLVEQGKVDVDAPVSKYLPAFAGKGKQNVTVHELLTHYSGLPPDVDLQDSWGLAKPDKAEGLRRAFTSPLDSAPGTKFEYSDINYIVLGALVEMLSGETLSSYARENIFSQLDLRATRFHPADEVCGSFKRSGSAILWAPNWENGTNPDGSMWSRVSDYFCPATDWIPLAAIPQTAPTAHDDQGTAATNPDFDHLLRGTVHDPTARRMGGVAGHAGIFSTADDLAKFAQALLDKLLRNTGPFPLTQATLRLMTTPQQPTTALANATIFTQSGETAKGVALRGLGWDLNTAFSRPRGTLFPLTTATHPGSFGHTGFTGTSLWIDPVSESYVILLSNAIHPRGAPPISKLRGDVATAAARALLGPVGQTPTASACTCTACAGCPNLTIGKTPLETVNVSYEGLVHPLNILFRGRGPGSVIPATRTGIDVLESTHFAALHAAAAHHGGHLRYALLSNAGSLDAEGHRTADILAHALPGETTLLRLFSPEHGLSATQDTEHLAAETDAATHLPVTSLYRPKPADRHLTHDDLGGLDAIVVDLQDAGVRFWTYETLLASVLEAVPCLNVEVIVLDRPNPLGGLAVEGPSSDHAGPNDPLTLSPMPLRHGLTIGELARLYEPPINCRATTRRAGTPVLTVMPMENWYRPQLFADTGLTWTPPSPNLRSPTAALLYPGVALTEQTNVSVGRGTATPFENLGAAWIDADALAAYLNARHIPGIAFTATSVTVDETPEHYPFHGKTVPAVHFAVLDAWALNSPELGIELLAALHHLYPATFQLARAGTLLANQRTLEALTRGDDPRTIARSWGADLEAFRVKRKSVLLYPEK